MATKKKAAKGEAVDLSHIAADLRGLAKSTAKLKFDPRNARTHGKRNIEAVMASLKRFGQRKPLVVLESGQVVAGNGTLEAAAELAKDDPRWCMLAVSVFEKEDEAVAYAIADNRTAELAEWDSAVLHKSLSGLQDGGFDIGEIGFTMPDFKKLEVDAHQRTVGQTPDPDVTKPPDDPDSAVGEVYELGPHRLACGDATDPEVLAGLMGGETFACMVTDPPYGVSYAAKNEFLNAVAPGNRNQTPIESDHMKPEEMSEFWASLFGAARKIASPGASYYVTGPQGGDLLLLLLLALQKSGFPLRHMLIWAKNNHVLGRSDYNYKHEPILYGWVDGAGHYFGGGGGETSLWEIPKPQVSKEHPTMKPVELFARAIRNGCRPGGLVFDPCLGSGTTIIAAAQEGRAARGAEISPAYCDVIRRRWTSWAEDAGVDPGSGALA